MSNPKDVPVEAVVNTVSEKAAEVTRAVEEVEEMLATKSCSCWVFGWNILVTKSPKPETVSNISSKE